MYDYTCGTMFVRPWFRTVLGRVHVMMLFFVMRLLMMFRLRLGNLRGLGHDSSICRDTCQCQEHQQRQ